MAMPDLHQEHAADGCDPVSPETFAAAIARFDLTLERYTHAAAQRQYAELALQALQCRASFTYTVEGPVGDHDVFDIEGECLLQKEHHPDDHVEEYTAADGANDVYAAAHHRFLNACAVAGDLHVAWEDAEEALEMLRCAKARPGAWPCVSRRGHLDDHDHPTTMHLVL